MHGIEVVFFCELHKNPIRVTNNLLFVNEYLASRCIVAHRGRKRCSGAEMELSHDGRGHPLVRV